MIGFQITFLLEIAIRRTFLNHKYCIQSTYKLNYEKEQQEQLLRSCFPQHLIEQIRNEIRESLTRISKRQSVPFKPFYNLYVEKYENVTILYADIVNSMNLTDKLNPAELVETLNELYGRFDEAAEKYACLRIKLLGDCYYCVSGLPEYEDDHAMKCLLMGLEMIKIINSIRQSRSVDIDMRIGIHSGSVLSGLLGLRKWQFDIWSFDAMKANRMEHSGQPGFVHITQETLNLLPKDHERRKDLIITATRQSTADDSEETYLVSERYNPRSGLESPQSRRRGQTEKLKAYIEKLRVGHRGDSSYRKLKIITTNYSSLSRAHTGAIHRQRDGFHTETPGSRDQPKKVSRDSRKGRPDTQDGHRRHAAGQVSSQYRPSPFLAPAVLRRRQSSAKSFQLAADSICARAPPAQRRCICRSVVRMMMRALLYSSSVSWLGIAMSLPL